jgi:hypothetical protein
MNLGDTTIKAGLTGVVAAVGASMLFGESGNSNVAGISLPTPIVIGAACAGGSWVSDMVSDNIISQIPQSVEWAKAESLAIRLGVAGGASALALKFTTGLPNENLIKAAALGAGSKAAGEWINTNVVSMARSSLVTA